MKVILGFDILPMSSPNSRQGVMVAVHLQLSDGSNLHWKGLTREKLVSIIRKHQPIYIGTDNPEEILKTGENISSFYNQLPSSTSIVHVNLTSNGVILPIKTIIKSILKETIPHKLRPLQTAEYIVKLINKGTGMKLEPYEDETLISIGRPRHHHKGGWSQSRFERVGEETVASSASKLRTLLSKNSIPFDEVTISTRYGAKNSRFHIFVNRSKVDQVFRRKLLYPSKVKIWSPQKPIISHIPLIPEKKLNTSIIPSNHILVGIDPGMTTGIVITDLNLDLLFSKSKKNFSKGEILFHISNYGIPILVCADVNPIPTLVKKIAASFNSKLISPSIQLDKMRKKKLIQPFKSLKLDNHEKDALSAISYAYGKFDNQFSKLDKYHIPVEHNYLVKTLIFQGYSINESINLYEEAISLHSEDIHPIEILASESVPEHSQRELFLLNRIKNLIHENEKLKDELSNLRIHSNKIIGILKNKNRLIERIQYQATDKQYELTREAISSETIRTRDIEISNLRKKLKSSEKVYMATKAQIQLLEKLIWKSLDNEGSAIKILEKFTYASIAENIENKRLMPEDLLLVLDPSGGGKQAAIKLLEINLGFVFILNSNFSNEVIEIFWEKNIPFLRGEPYDISIVGNVALIGKSNLQKAFADFADMRKKIISDKKWENIELTIQNYQYEREKELKTQDVDYDDFIPEEY
jgi:predicted RNase H-like nuclease (RuvC/YqgF family)